jgi:hypothetical protein
LKNIRENKKEIAKELKWEYINTVWPGNSNNVIAQDPKCTDCLENGDGQKEMWQSVGSAA